MLLLEIMLLLAARDELRRCKGELAVAARRGGSLIKIGVCPSFE